MSDGMGQRTLHHLLKLLAEDISRPGIKDCAVPTWVLMRNDPASSIHDGRWLELVTAKSERAMQFFDVLAHGHRCQKGRRLCCAHDSILAWPHIRRMWRDAAEADQPPSARAQ